MSEAAELRSSRLSEIRDREGKATPGPWQSHWNDELPEDVRVCLDRDGVCTMCIALAGETDDGGAWTPETLARWRGDADFIAHSRDDVRWLLAEVDRLQALLGRRFPIVGGPSVPWHVMAPHEAQAQKNHGQSLEQLAVRGGLSPAEAWCVVHDIRWRDRPADPEARWAALAAKVNAP